jgi:hypothetical protein
MYESIDNRRVHAMAPMHNRADPDEDIGHRDGKKFSIGTPFWGVGYRGE